MSMNGWRLVWGGLVGCRRWLGLGVSPAVSDGLVVCSRRWFCRGGLPFRFSMLSAHVLDLLFQAGLALLEVVVLVLQGIDISGKGGDKFFEFLEFSGQDLHRA